MLFGSAVFAQENTSYESALKLYQEGRFAESESAFMQVLQTQTDNKFALYNWGLAAYQAGQKGKALAAWRRALTIDPDFAGPRRALDFAATEMPAQVFARSRFKSIELGSICRHQRFALFIRGFSRSPLLRCSASGAAR